MNYGKKGLSLDFPDDWDLTVIEKKEMPILPEPVEAVRSALSNPVGSKTLAEEAKGCNSACVLMCDITRPVPNHLVLPVLVKELMAAGMDASNITVLVATGLHRPNEGEELREVVGDDWVMDTVKVVNHFARDHDDHVTLGTTKRGTTIKIDHRFVNADLRIVTGLVEPHFMAGYSGGRKVIDPGIAHQDTITSLHTASFLEDPKAANCVVEGNPLHEEQMDVLSMVGPCLAVNTVIDEHRRLSFVNFGEIVESHFEAVDYMRQYAEIRVPKKFKTVVTSSAGYPLDKTYYQTIKGMVGAMDVLQPGGNLFIVSECSEGLGSPDYVESQRRLVKIGPDAFMDEISPKSHAAIDEWETEMQIKPMRIGNIHIYAEGFSEADWALTGANNLYTVEALQEAIEKSVEGSGDKGVAVIPEGPYVIPLYRS
jgi:nickel-dependent lactate racemase